MTDMGERSFTFRDLTLNIHRVEEWYRDQRPSIRALVAKRADRTGIPVERPRHADLDQPHRRLSYEVLPRLGDSLAALFPSAVVTGGGIRGDSSAIATWML